MTNRFTVAKRVRAAAAVANPYTVTRVNRWTNAIEQVGCYNARVHHGVLEVRIPADIGWIWLPVVPGDLLPPRKGS